MELRSGGKGCTQLACRHSELEVASTPRRQGCRHTVRLEQPLCLVCADGAKDGIVFVRFSVVVDGAWQGVGAIDAVDPSHFLNLIIRKVPS